MTREEVAVMVAKPVGLNVIQRATKFKDVLKSHKNRGYIQSAMEAGIKTCVPMCEYYLAGVSSSHPTYATVRDGDKDV